MGAELIQTDRRTDIKMILGAFTDLKKAHREKLINLKISSNQLDLDGLHSNMFIKWLSKLGDAFVIDYFPVPSNSILLGDTFKRLDIK